MESWREDFRLRIYEVAPDGGATAATMMNVFQEAASHHAEALGMGFPHLKPRKLGWVLNRFRLKMRRYPVYGETISIRTWPRMGKRIFAYRDVVFSVGEDSVGFGSSVWCLIDTEERKALSLCGALDSFPCRDERVFDEEIPSVPAVQAPKWEWRTDARYSELDLNGHVNNSVYLGWALEPLPPEYVARRVPEELLFFFRKEVSLGDPVVSLAEDGGGGATVHSLEAVDGGELARVSIRWRDRI